MISNIGTSSIVGKIFSPIVTTLSFDELNEIYNGGQYLPISNSVLFSIPQDADGNDLEYEGSIWLTDKNGYLYPMTPTYNTILKFENFMETYIANNTVLNYKISSISWSLENIDQAVDLVNNVTNTNPLLSSKTKSKLKIKIIYDNGSTGYLDINEYLLNFEVYINTTDNTRAGIHWYTNPGEYYIKAVIPSFRCQNDSDVSTEDYLTYTIVDNESNSESNENTGENDKPLTYYYWYNF